MNKIYLQLDEKKARFFEYSKDPKEGFEKNESVNAKISYRKYHEDGVIGTLKFINENEDRFEKGSVKKLTLVVDAGDNRYYLNFNILTANGNMNQFVEQLIPILPNLKAGEAYRFYPYEMPSEYKDKDGNERTGVNKGVSVYTYDLANDTKLEKVAKAHSFAKDGDIPGVVWTKVTKMGVVKNIKDDTDRVNFLYDVLQKSLTVSNQSSAPKEQPVTTSKKDEPKQEAAAKPATLTEEEHDDLPF